MKSSTRIAFTLAFLFTAILFVSILMIGGYIAFGLEYEMADMAAHAGSIPFMSAPWLKGSKKSEWKGYTVRWVTLPADLLSSGLENGRLMDVKMMIEEANGVRDMLIDVDSNELVDGDWYGMLYLYEDGGKRFVILGESGW